MHVSVGHRGEGAPSYFWELWGGLGHPSAPVGALYGYPRVLLPVVLSPLNTTPLQPLRPLQALVRSRTGHGISYLPLSGWSSSVFFLHSGLHGTEKSKHANTRP